MSTKELLTTTTTTSPTGGRRTRPTADPAFDAFWDAYPKHTGKGDAHRAWTRATRSTNPDTILDVVRRYPFRTDDLKYVKDPATWLNKGCWDDDLAHVAAANGRYRPDLHATKGDRPSWQA